LSGAERGGGKEGMKERERVGRGAGAPLTCLVDATPLPV